MTRVVRALAAIVVAGCAARGTPPPLAPEVLRLNAELDSAFSGAAFTRASWGVFVQSLDNGQVFYRRNAQQLFMPASNQKILTGAVALARLGPDFRYRTPVLARGTRSGDTLAGDLVVIGRGDVTLSQHATGGADVLAALRPWADSITARGIRVVTGRVVGDATFFPGPVLGEGWMWDDLQDSYSAPVGALQFNEGFAVIEVTPDSVAGQPARVRLLPSEAPLRLYGSVLTAPRDSNINDVDYERVFYTDSVMLGGRLSAGRAPLMIQAAVTDPTRYFENALTQALRDAGVAVLGTRLSPSGTIVPVPPAGSVLMSNGTPADPRAPIPDTLFFWQSLPLREMLPLLEKPSQNQIAEAFLYTLGALRGQASADSGRAVLRETLTSWGIPEDAYSYRDGSGLSRYNYVAPEAIGAVLWAMGRHPDFEVFYQALPIAGVDGSIRNRMRGTAAENNAHAKTGSIANVRTLSGYVTTRDGERLIFVLMANHFTASSRVADRVQDLVVERLANFTRAGGR